MKTTIFALILVGIFFSCNNERIAELEAENMELKSTIELCSQESKEAQAAALQAVKAAEEQALHAREAMEGAKK